MFLNRSRLIGRFVGRYYKAVDKTAVNAGVMGANLEPKLETEKVEKPKTLVE